MIKGYAKISIPISTEIPQNVEDPNIYFDKWIESWAKEHNIELTEETEIDAYIEEEEE